jgi:hypothetical protein
MSGAQAGNEKTITIFGVEDRGDRSFVRPGEARLGKGELPAKELRGRVGSFLESMQEVIVDLPTGFGDFAMDTVTITAEVTAKGQVSLLGTGAEVSGKGGITFTFQRPPRSTEPTEPPGE